LDLTPDLLNGLAEFVDAHFLEPEHAETGHGQSPAGEGEPPPAEPDQIEPATWSRWASRARYFDLLHEALA
jgi:hypothetical protein